MLHILFTELAENNFHVQMQFIGKQKLYDLVSLLLLLLFLLIFYDIISLGVDINSPP